MIPLRMENQKENYYKPKMSIKTEFA